MKKVKKAPSLFTRLSHGLVRFLALTAVMPQVMGGQNAPHPRGLLTRQGEFFDASPEIEPLAPVDFSSIEYKFYVGMLDEAPAELFLEGVKKLLSEDDKGEEQFEANEEKAMRVMHALNDKYLEITIKNNIRSITRIKQSGALTRFKSDNGKLQSFTEFELFAIADLVGFSSKLLSDTEGKLYHYTDKHINSLSQLLKKDIPERLVVEGYLHNFVVYLIERERLMNADFHDTRIIRRVFANMLEFHEGIRKASSGAELDASYASLNLAKKLVEAYIKRALRDTSYDFSQANEHSLGRFEALLDSLGFESAGKIFGDERRSLDDEYRQLYSQHTAGELDLDEFKELQSEIDEKAKDLADRVKAKSRELSGDLYSSLRSFKLGVIVLLIHSLLKRSGLYQDQVEILDNILRYFTKGNLPVDETKPESPEPAPDVTVKETKRNKKIEAKVSKIVTSDPEVLAAQEKVRLEALKDYEQKQAEAREARDQQEKAQAEARREIREAQAKRDAILEEVFNRVYKTLSSLKSDKGSVEKLFKGSGLRQTTLTKILQSGIDYFIEGSHEINQKLLAKDILGKLGVTGHFHLDLVKKFDEIYEKGEDAVRARKALEDAKAAELAQEEAARLAEEARRKAEEAERAENERMILNKALYTIEKGKAKVKAPVVSSSSSSSSSSSTPLIGFSSKEDADQVKALLLEWMALVTPYQSPENISNDLFELKHDLIKLAAIAEQINLKGARVLVNSLFDYPTLNVIRNGALHLLEIAEDEDVQIKFYQGVLLQLGTIASLKINEETLTKGLNHLMKQTIREWPGVDFSAQTEHSMFKSFEADAVTWKDDHEKKMRSDVMEAIEARQQWLDETSSTHPKRKTMIQVEMAELYNQLKNSGIKIPPFAHRMIAEKNAFAHQGKTPSFDKRTVALTQ